MRQDWRDLLFLHWEWDAEDIARRLPDGLEPDLWNDRAYLGVVAFEMRGVRPVGLPALPGVSSFPELNLRTYVRDRHGRTAVWFFSLDVTKRLAVAIARRFFHLPYFRARMRVTRDGGGIRHHAWRSGMPRPDDLAYTPDGVPAPCAAGTLDSFLIDRFTFIARDGRGGRLLCGTVRHAPYQVSAARVAVGGLGVFDNDGFEAPGRPPDAIHYSPGVDVRACLVRPAG